LARPIVSVPLVPIVPNVPKNKRDKWDDWDNKDMGKILEVFFKAMFRQIFMRIVAIITIWIILYSPFFQQKRIFGCFVLKIYL
jgi:hypothetical protein